MESNNKKGPKKLNKQKLLVLIILLMVGGGFIECTLSCSYQTTQKAGTFMDSRFLTFSA